LIDAIGIATGVLVQFLEAKVPSLWDDWWEKEETVQYLRPAVHKRWRCDLPDMQVDLKKILDR
jgi:hypothetical protein